MLGAPKVGDLAAPKDVAVELPVLPLPPVAPPNLKGSELFDDPVWPKENGF